MCESWKNMHECYVCLCVCERECERVLDTGEFNILRFRMSVRIFDV